MKAKDKGKEKALEEMGKEEVQQLFEGAFVQVQRLRSSFCGRRRYIPCGFFAGTFGEILGHQVLGMTLLLEVQT